MILVRATLMGTAVFFFVFILVQLTAAGVASYITMSPQWDISSWPTHWRGIMGAVGALLGLYTGAVAFVYQYIK